MRASPVLDDLPCIAVGWMHPDGEDNGGAKVKEFGTYDTVLYLSQRFSILFVSHSLV